TAGSNTSHSATISSEATPCKFAAPRPPTPIIAILSFSLRLRPCRTAGTASTLTDEPTTIRPNCRRVDFPREGKEVELRMKKTPELFLAVDRSVTRQGSFEAPRTLLGSTERRGVSSLNLTGAGERTRL